MRRTILIVIGLLILIGLVLLGWQRVNSSPAAAATLQTAAVERGTLVATVNAAGNITAKASATLTFPVSGTVQKVYVKKGDVVAAGQPLVQLDTTDLEYQVKQAEASLIIAQAKLDQTKAGPTPEELAVAEAAVQSAQATYQVEQAKLGLRDQQIKSARADVDKAAAALLTAQADYDAHRDSSSYALALQQASIAYQKAVADYNVQLATLNDVALRNAAAQLAQARLNLEKLKTKPTQEDLAIAQAQVEQARISLEQARLKLKNATLTAPFNGVVTAMNAIEGLPATSNPVTLVDMSTLTIETNMAELDVAKIRSGQEVQVMLDALPNVQLAGRVNLVLPVATVTQGVVNYPVSVTLLNPDPAVKPGMTANISIIVDRRDNVVLVPNRALRTQGRQRVVEVMFEGRRFEVPVQIGMTGETSSEVLAGLKEGDVVVLTTTTTRPGGVPGMPGMGGFFGR